MPETTAALRPDELNPRQITPEQQERLKKSLAAYGDISGVVFNRRTRKLVGGHQRAALFGDDCPIEAKYLDKPDKQGTLAFGYITLQDGSKMSYREVDWPPEIAYAAMIAANANGGDWEPTKLREALTLISEDAGATVDSETLGLESDFLEKLFRGQELQLNIQEMEQKGLDQPLTLTEVKNLPSQTAMIQTFYTVATRSLVIDNLKKLQVLFGAKNLSDTAAKAYEFALLHKGLYSA